MTLENFKINKLFEQEKTLTKGAWGSSKPSRRRKKTRVVD